MPTDPYLRMKAAARSRRHAALRRFAEEDKKRSRGRVAADDSEEGPMQMFVPNPPPTPPAPPTEPEPDDGGDNPA